MYLLSSKFYKLIRFNLFSMKEQLDYTDALDRELTFIKKQGKLSEIIISLFSDSYYLSEDAVRFGILGDLHGHISLGLSKLKKWQEYSGLKIDAILQVGDLTVFNEQSVLDKVTHEMAEKDPDELGFINYYRQSDEADYFFGENSVFSNTPLYFILGNHDDASLLERELKISFYDNIRYMPNGSSETIKKNSLSIDIGALGENYSNNDIKRLSDKNLDILLTHRSPKSKANPEGEEKLGNFIEDNDIKYNFFGHIHDGALKCTLPYKKQYGLNEVRLKRKKLKRGSIGFLEISKSDSQFLYIPED